MTSEHNPRWNGAAWRVLKVLLSLAVLTVSFVGGIFADRLAIEKRAAGDEQRIVVLEKRADKADTRFDQVSDRTAKQLEKISERLARIEEHLRIPQPPE